MVSIARGFAMAGKKKEATVIFLACFTKLSPYSSTVVFAVNHFFPTIFKVLRVREGVSFNVCI